MDTFEELPEAERVSVERFVRFRLHAKGDADDVLQGGRLPIETYDSGVAAEQFPDKDGKTVLRRRYTVMIGPLTDTGSPGVNGCPKMKG